MPPKKSQDGTKKESWGAEQWTQLAEYCDEALQAAARDIARKPAFAPYYLPTNGGLDIKRRVGKIGQMIREHYGARPSAKATASPKRKAKNGTPGDGSEAPATPTKKVKVS